MEVSRVRVEGLVGRMSSGLMSAGKFSAGEGMSAILTFAQRFAETMLKMSQGEDRETNRRMVIGALREMAMKLEMEALGENGKGMN